MVLVLKKGASKEEIDAINKQLEKLGKNKKRLDAYKYCGIMNLSEDALIIQKRLRDEWD